MILTSARKCSVHSASFDAAALRSASEPICPRVQPSTTEPPTTATTEQQQTTSLRSQPTPDGTISPTPTPDATISPGHLTPDQTISTPTPETLSQNTRRTSELLCHRRTYERRYGGVRWQRAKFRSRGCIGSLGAWRCGGVHLWLRDLLLPETEEKETIQRRNEPASHPTHQHQ